MRSLAGLVLAAGAGRRNGRPKALEHTPEGIPWVVRAYDVMRAAGCSRVLIVLGAEAKEAARLVPRASEVVIAESWAEGVSRSLDAGLGALGTDEDAALVSLVDLPDLPTEAAIRVAAHAGTGALARAVYAHGPGHPVLLGRDHWAPLRRSLVGDEGARDYLRAHGAIRVDCRDLDGGQDIDVHRVR